MTNKELLEDLLIEFDELGMEPTTIVPNPSERAIRWKRELMCAIEHLGAEWISVDERLPDIDLYGKGRYGGARSVRVLCACKQRSGRTFAKEGYYEPCGNGKVFWRIPGSVDSVTHWMPLPEPPEGD